MGVLEFIGFYLAVGFITGFGFFGSQKVVEMMDAPKPPAIERKVNE